MRPAQAKDDSALWAFRYAENLAQMRFGPMMRDIKKVAATWERRALSLQAARRARPPLPRRRWGGGGLTEPEAPRSSHGAPTQQHATSPTPHTRGVSCSPRPARVRSVPASSRL